MRDRIAGEQLDWDDPDPEFCEIFFFIHMPGHTGADFCRRFSDRQP